MALGRASEGAGGESCQQQDRLGELHFDCRESGTTGKGCGR